MDDTHHGAPPSGKLSYNTRSRRHATTGAAQPASRTSDSDLRAALQAAELRAEAAERHARHLEARFEALASISTQWIWTSSADGHIKVHIADSRLFSGSEEANIQAIDWVDAIHPDDREHALTAWAHAVATQTTYDNVQRVRRADGTYRTLQVRAVPGIPDDTTAPEWVGTSTDITDQVAHLEREHAARAEAEAVKAQLQAVLDVLPLGLVIADATGHTLMINPAAYTMWGDDAPFSDALTSYREYKGYWPTTGQRLESEEWALARSLLYGAVVVGEEVAIETFDGERKTILNSTAPIRDANGTIVGGVAAMLEVSERKRLEQEAIERAAQLDATYDALGDGIALVDDKGKVQRMNAAARDLLVYSVDPAEYTALSASEQKRQQVLCDADGNPLPLEQWPRFRVARGEVLQGATAVDLLSRSRDGRTMYLTATGAPIRDATGRILGGVVVHRDETRRKLLEHAFRASIAEARHRADELDAILNAITDGVLFYDADGRLVSTNEAARRILTDTENSPDPWTLPERSLTFAARDLYGNVLSPEQHPFARILRGEVLTGSDTVEIETHRMDGSSIMISVSGAPLRDEQGGFRGAVCVLRDMTGRLLLEKALRERESMFRGTFEQAAVGMAHTGLDGRWLRVNDRICAITGYTREEMLSSRFQDITHPDDLKASNALSRDLLAGKSQTYSTEKRYIRKNGQCIWVNLTVSLVRTPTGAPSYFISVIEDISAHKALEQQRSDLLSIVAHDLSNPLTVMKTRIQVLHRQLAAGKTPDASVPKATESALRRMERLVNDLRDATSADTHQLTLKVEHHDLVTLCRMEAEAQIQMNKGRLLELVLPEEPITAEIDYDRITRVLGNLLSNAIKYSPADQPITLSLERQIEPSGDEPGQPVAQITVRDRGVGIPADLVPHIFEKFYRVPGTHEEQQTQPSLGLGLYICRTLVEEHHGTLRVETPAGPGTMFVVTLPLTYRKQS